MDLEGIRIKARHDLTPHEVDDLENRLYEVNASRTAYEDAALLGFIAKRKANSSARSLATVGGHLRTAPGLDPRGSPGQRPRGNANDRGHPGSEGSRVRLHLRRDARLPSAGLLRQARIPKGGRDSRQASWPHRVCDASASEVRCHERMKARSLAIAAANRPKGLDRSTGDGGPWRPNRQKPRLPITRSYSFRRSQAEALGCHLGYPMPIRRPKPPPQWTQSVGTAGPHAGRTS